MLTRRAVKALHPAHQHLTLPCNNRHQLPMFCTAPQLSCSSFTAPPMRECVQNQTLLHRLSGTPANGAKLFRAQHAPHDQLTPTTNRMPNNIPVQKPINHGMGVLLHQSPSNKRAKQPLVHPLAEPLRSLRPSPPQ